MPEPVLPFRPTSHMSQVQQSTQLVFVSSVQSDPHECFMFKSSGLPVIKKPILLQLL